jgi:hypothetical protein
MAEGDDYTPAPWAAKHDFTQARKTYDQHAGRSYADASTARVSASTLVPDFIETKSRHPLLIRCDISGSMGGWPGTMFSKIPYVDHEVRTEYLGEDAVISYGAIGDTNDSYTLQVQPFTIGEEMKTSLTNLVIEGGGAGPGHYCEAYCVAALYDIHNVRFPKAAGKPPLIYIGDEMPYHTVSRADAKNFAKVDLEGSHLGVKAIFAELMRRYSVYLILKPYGSESFSGDSLSGVTKEVHANWVSLIGADRIALLPDAGRVVDVIFGILAKEADKVEYFREEIEGRQRPDQVETVYKSLLTVHGGDPDSGKPKGGSTLHKPAGGKKSKGLLDK